MIVFLAETVAKGKRYPGKGIRAVRSGEHRNAPLLRSTLAGDYLPMPIPYSLFNSPQFVQS
jgi:hypothetical protein